mgnify:CR=1 FL=1
MRSETEAIRELPRAFADCRGWKEKFKRSRRLVPSGHPEATTEKYDSHALLMCHEKAGDFAELLLAAGWPDEVVPNVVEPAAFSFRGVAAKFTGFLHREKDDAGRLHGKAVDKQGRLMYFEHGQLHREDGPAVIHPDGEREFFRSNERVETAKPGQEPETPDRNVAEAPTRA